MSIQRLNPGRWARAALRSTVSAAGHLLGVAVIFCLSWWVLLPGYTRAALREAYHQGLFHDRPTELLIHLGLSACFWALLVIGWHLVRAPSSGQARRIVKARGAVMLETAVVFPVFLMTTLGLIQLTLTNTAALLTSLAAYNSARTIAVWYPETDPSNPPNPGRMDVDGDMVLEKATLAAAAALAPVAPSDFRHQASGDCANSESLEARIEALEAIGHEHESGVSGLGDYSLARALDQSDFAHRGQTKLRAAYCAVTVDYVVNPDQHTMHVQVEYKDYVTIPLVGPIFGEYESVAGRDGFFSTITRDHETTYQLWHYPDLPGTGGILW